MALLPPLALPPGRMTGPPPAPPDVPTLSSYREDDGDTGSPDKAHAGALPKLFFNAEKALEAIAAAVPKFSDEVDDINNALRDLLSKVMSEGVHRLKYDQEGLPSYR